VNNNSLVKFAIVMVAALTVVMIVALLAFDHSRGTDAHLALVTITGDLPSIFGVAYVYVTQRRTDEKVEEVRSNVNGRMTEMIAKLPDGSGEPNTTLWEPPAH
jgi:hypothetical protein